MDWHTCTRPRLNVGGPLGRLGKRRVGRRDRGHRDVDDLTAAASQGFGDEQRSVHSGQRVGDGVTAEHRPVGIAPTRPPATAASSPNAVQFAGSPSAPWPVIRSHTRPGAGRDVARAEAAVVSAPPAATTR